jgi:hypothetical protein
VSNIINSDRLKRTQILLPKQGLSPRVFALVEG